MGEALCRKVFKGVALAGAGVAIGAAVFTFSMRRVRAASPVRSVGEETPVVGLSASTTSSSGNALSGFGSASSLGLKRQNNSDLSLGGGCASGSWDLQQQQGGSSSFSGDLADFAEVVDRPTKWNYNWDLRDPSFTNRARPKHTRHLFFILHGHYITNGETNLHFLSSLGKTQLELTGKRLVTLGLPFKRIIHSSALRCKQSVSILRGHLPDMETLEDDLLLECAPESFVSNQKFSIGANSSSSSSSSFYEDGARIEAAYRKYLHRADLNQKSDSYEVVVTHANVIRYFVCRALQLPPEAWLRMSLHNGSITWLSIRPDGLVFVRELGDTGHMPANDELKNPDGSLILTKMPSKMQSWYLQEAKDEDDYYGTVQL